MNLKKEKKFSIITRQKMSAAAKKNVKKRLINLSKGWGWNKGLTKENSDGVRRISEAKKGIKHSDEHKRKNSESHIGLMAGDKHPRWKGGRKNHLGYIMIKKWGHHRVNSSGYVFEHIVIWEEANNSLLLKDMCIHHLNGIKNDNRIENLTAMPKKQHSPKSIIEPFKKRIKELEEKILKLENNFPLQIKEGP